MAGDRRHSEEISIQIKYSEEVAENFEPASGIIRIVEGPAIVWAEKWRINRVFNFMSGTTVLCLGGVIISPTPVVQIASSAIWLSAAALSRHLLSSAYNGKETET